MYIVHYNQIRKHAGDDESRIQHVAPDHLSDPCVEGAAGVTVVQAGYRQGRYDLEQYQDEVARAQEHQHEVVVCDSPETAHRPRQQGV
ncbi:hypothetical protein BSFG_04914, partial [Bacteroides sp. 4_3_47FAA]